MAYSVVIRFRSFEPVRTDGSIEAIQAQNAYKKIDYPVPDISCSARIKVREKITLNSTQIVGSHKKRVMSEVPASAPPPKRVCTEERAPAFATWVEEVSQTIQSQKQETNDLKSKESFLSWETCLSTLCNCNTDDDVTALRNVLTEMLDHLSCDLEQADHARAKEKYWKILQYKEYLSENQVILLENAEYALLYRQFTNDNDIF